MPDRPSLSDYADTEEEDSNQPSPIGVPRGYTTVTGSMPSPGSTASDRWRQSRQQPRYWTGAQWTEVRSLKPEDRASLQLVLKQLGLIPQSSRLVLGSWDDASASGFKEVLAWANVNGTTWQGALEQMLTSRDEFGELQPEGEELPNFVAEVANPEDIKRAFREGMKSRLGSGAVDEGRLDAAVAAFQQQQVAAQRAQYDATYTGTGGTVTAPMGIETFVDREAQKADPAAYDAYKSLDAFSTILDAMGGSGAPGS